MNDTVRGITIHEVFEQGMPRIWGYERAIRQIVLNTRTSRMPVLCPQTGIGPILTNAHNGCLPLKQNLMVLGGLPNPNQDYAGRSTGTPRASTQPAREDKKFSLASKNKIFAYLPRSLQRAVSWP